MRKLLLTIAVLVMPVSLAAGLREHRAGRLRPIRARPAGASIYGEANLKPEGDQKQAIDSILSKFPGGGQAGDKLKDLIEKGLRESDAPISFKQDIEPWLGDEAAFFATGIGANGQLEASAGLIATDDEGKARDALEKSAEGKTQKHSYKGVDYLTDDSGQAGAVFDGFVVLGTEAGVKAAIDASKGGPTLSDDDAYTKAIENAASDRLGLFYVNSPEFLTAARQSGAPLPDSFKQFLQEPVVATVDADDDGVVVEANVPPELGKAFAFFGQGSDLLDRPARRLVARPGPEGPREADRVLRRRLAGVTGGRDAIEGQFKAATGLDLQKDVLTGWATSASSSAAPAWRAWTARSLCRPPTRPRRCASSRRSRGLRRRRPTIRATGSGRSARPAAARASRS